MRFLKAQLKDGEVVIGRFDKLTRVQRYATQVMSGQKPFFAWRVAGDTHPHSGEPCLLRTRVMYSGSAIESIQEVVALATRPEDSYDEMHFVPAIEIQKGEAGTLWVCPTNPEQIPEGAVAGEKYPVHVDPSTLERFVILKVATGEPEEAEATPEVRFYTERSPEAVGVTRDSEDEGEDEDNDEF